MSESLNQIVDSIPRFVLPKEFSNEPKPDAPATPVVPPAEAAKSAPEPSEQASETPPEKEAAEPEKETTGKDPEKATTRRFERRIDRATRRAAEAQARAEVLERQIEELKSKQAAPADPQAPKMENFTDIEEYAKARAAHEVSKSLKERDEKQRTDAATAAQQKLAVSWAEKVAKAEDKYEDFAEVVGDLKPTTPWAIALMEADNGPDIAHYLGSHPKEVERLMGLNPLSQVREIGKLESKLSAQPAAPKQPSKAPPPITPVGASAQAGEPELGSPMPFEQYRQLGNKAFRAR